MGVFRAVGDQHLGDTGNLGGGLRGGIATGAGDQHVNVPAADLLGSGHGVQRRRLQRRIVVFCNDKNAHFLFLASCCLR